MRILLIAPAWPDPIWGNNEGRGRTSRAIFPPLNLLMIAAATPPGHTVQIVDEGVSQLDENAPADLVGITAMTANAPRAYELAERFRARGIPVVLGGMHPSALPDEALQHCDAVVVGEGEELWPRAVADAEQGRLQSIYRAEKSPSLAGLPVPRRSLADPRRYLLPTTMQATRGCPFACDFCAVSHFFGRGYRFRPVEEVVQEVRDSGHKVIAFVDDNIVGSPTYAKALFRALEPLGIRWISQGSLNMAKDPELLELAARSGCVGMFIGFESLSPENLAAMHKRQNRADEFSAAIRSIHEHGIAIEGAFVFGFDGDDEGVFERTVRFARQNRLEAAQFGILTPFPGTPLREKLEAEGRIFDNNWAHYNISQVVFKPLRMSAQTLQQGFNWAWQEFYSLGSMVHRLGWFRRNASILWAINLNARQRLRHFLEKMAVTGGILAPQQGTH